MKAMILAAGLGTRLRPLTNTRPKALVEIDGKPLLELVLETLIAASVTDVVINLHHFPEQIRRFLESRQNFGINISYSEEPELLDTGGGLKKASSFLAGEEAFILHNVDVLSNIDLQQMVAEHRASKSLATLAVKQRKTSRYFLFDEEGVLCGWKSVSGNQTKMARKAKGALLERAFCGIHVISPEIFEKLHEEGAFSIVDSYLRLAGAGEQIKAFRADDYDWRDVGKLEELK